jgi:hypothetical protein
MENKQLRTQQGKFETVINPWDDFGYFEHEDYGDEWGGGLWFEGKNLIDYDGVYELPSEVIAGIRELGYIVTQEFE